MSNQDTPTHLTPPSLTQRLHLPEGADAETLAPLASLASELVEAAASPNTRKAYAADWRAFTTWCASVGLDPIPCQPATVALFIAAQVKDGKAVSTIKRRVGTIRRVHKSAEHPDPTDHEAVRKELRGVAKALKGRKKHQMTALLPQELYPLIRLLDDEGGRAAIRDKALILLGYAIGQRGEQLVNLEVQDLEFRAQGVLVHIRSSKTDQTGQGHSIPVHYSARGQETCPVFALRRHIAVSGIDQGRVFRSKRGGDTGLTVAGLRHIIRRRLAQVGLDASAWGSHSLRAGHVTERLARQDSIERIMETTGHKSFRTLLDYKRKRRRMFGDGDVNATEKVGL